jgi:AcrR family transcriptional regulator
VTRWQPDAQGRLEQAALDLYVEQGYENTTVAEIAARAGLTERTFFRYFSDKREVLFSGTTAFQDLIVDAIVDAPVAASPIDAVTRAFDALATFFQTRRDVVQRRQAIIAANAELRERELIKLSSTAAAMAGALRSRGVREPAASLTAEAGMAAFRVAFERWAKDPKRRSLSRLVHESLDTLRTVTAG